MQSYFRILKNPELDNRATYNLDLKVYEVSRGGIAKQSGADNGKSMRNVWVSETTNNRLPAVEEKARQIMAFARAEAEECRKKSYLDGYGKGHDEGYNDGLAKGIAETEEIRARTTRLLKQLNEMHKKTFNEMSDEIMETAVAIAEKIVCKELSMTPESVLAVVQEAIGMVADRENIVLIVNPQQIELLESKQDLLRSQLSSTARLRFLGDPDVKPGGCMIVTESGEVDATLDSRWGEMSKVLFFEATS